MFASPFFNLQSFLPLPRQAGLQPFCISQIASFDCAPAFAGRVSLSQSTSFQAGEGAI
jgi:hypothetical protein